MKNITFAFALLFMMNFASAQTWEKLNDVPFYNDHSNGFGFNDKAYIIQGEPVGGKNKLWEYTPATDSWEDDGCCTNPPITIDNITANNVDLQWNNILGAQTYDIRWKPIDETVWSSATLSNNDFDISDLLDCTEYELQIKSVCTIAEIEFSESIFFYTSGCGSCLDLDFCSVTELDGSNDYIDEVSINNYVNNSGSNDGYGNFALPESEALMVGETFELSIKTVNDFFELNLKVWIDFDANGVFAVNEMVVQETYVDTGVTQNILIPNNAEVGLVRMRILYDFDGGIPCTNSSFNFGEAEDYCLNITTVTSNENSDLKQNKFSVYPNPFQNRFKIKTDFATNKKHQLSIVNVIGETVQTINNFDFNNEINLSSFPSGIYFLKIKDESNLIETIKLVKE